VKVAEREKREKEKEKRLGGALLLWKKRVAMGDGEES